MHDLHNMFNFKRKKNIHAVSALYLFVGNCLPEHSVFFLANLLAVLFFFKALTIVTKFAVLHIVGVLSPA